MWGSVFFRFAFSSVALTQHFDVHLLLVGVVVFVLGHARVQALVVAAMDVLNVQGAVCHSLAHVGRQFDAT